MFLSQNAHIIYTDKKMNPSTEGADQQFVSVFFSFGVMELVYCILHSRTDLLYHQQELLMKIRYTRMRN